MTEPPAQLRTSWAKSVGSESSWGFGVSYQKNSPGCCPRRVPYNHAAVDADDKVEPRLDGELRVGVAQHLEPKGAVVLLGCRRRVAIEARYKAVEGVEHGVAAEWLVVVRVLLCCCVAVLLYRGVAWAWRGCCCGGHQGAPAQAVPQCRRIGARLCMGPTNPCGCRPWQAPSVGIPTASACVVDFSVLGKLTLLTLNVQYTKATRNAIRGSPCLQVQVIWRILSVIPWRSGQSRASCLSQRNANTTMTLTRSLPIFKSEPHLSLPIPTTQHALTSPPDTGINATPSSTFTTTTSASLTTPGSA